MLVHLIGISLLFLKTSHLLNFPEANPIIAPMGPLKDHPTEAPIHFAKLTTSKLKIQHSNSTQISLFFFN